MGWWRNFCVHIVKPSTSKLLSNRIGIKSKLRVIIKQENDNIFNLILLQSKFKNYFPWQITNDFNNYSVWSRNCQNSYYSLFCATIYCYILKEIFSSSHIPHVFYNLYVSLKMLSYLHSCIIRVYRWVIIELLS